MAKHTTPEGGIVRSAREARNMTRPDLASATGYAISASGLEKIELGQRGLSTAVAEAIATALNMPAADRETLMGYAKEPGRAEAYVELLDLVKQLREHADLQDATVERLSARVDELEARS